VADGDLTASFGGHTALFLSIKMLLLSTPLAFRERMIVAEFVLPPHGVCDIRKSPAFYKLLK